MSAAPSRGKTFTGFTDKERIKKLQSLEGSAAYKTTPLDSRGETTCVRCAGRKQRISAINREFQQLRELLITEKSVLNVCSSPAGNEIASSGEELELIQEGAKLRLTIDTLMRFQVCILYSATDIPMHS